MAELYTVDDRTIEVTHPDRVLFPAQGFTKADLVTYYRRIADTMLPHVAGRPLTMQRFPEGIEGEGFYQKEAPADLPDWIERHAIPLRDGERQTQLVCNSPAVLVYLASRACITPHVWLSRVDHLTRPDRLIFDLDPPDGDFQLVRDVARSLRDLLRRLALDSFVMTTGSRGLHVAVPLDRSADFDSVREFAREVAEWMVQRNPEQLTVELSRHRRGGKLFVDYLRNAYGQTAVAPYAVRALPGAPVATPLDWDELSESNLRAQSYTMHNMFRRLGQKADPWRAILRLAQSLDEPFRRLSAMRAGG